VTDVDNLAVTCPKCGARKGDPCTYVSLAGSSPSPWASATHKAKMARVGTPTKRTHIERGFALHHAIGRRFRDCRLGLRPVPIEVAAAARSIRELDRREAVQLAAWFRAYGSLFTELPRVAS
jgi:hypothetical protein